MSNPTRLTPYQEQVLITMIADLRSGSRGLRLGSDSPGRTPEERDADRAKAAEMDRAANDAARTLAVSRDAERSELNDHVLLCQRRVLDADRHGTIAQREEAEGCRLDAMAALLAFNQRTITMVPFNRVRR